MEVLGGSADTFDWVNFVALKGSTPKKEETETPVFTRKTMESNQSEGEKEKESLHKSMNTVATVSSSLPSRAEKREAFASRVLARIQQNAESKTQKRSSASPGLFPSPTQSLASNKALIEKFKLKVEAYQDKHVRALERERETLRERQQAQREPPPHLTRNVDDVKRQSGAACMKKNKTLAFEVGLLDGHRVGQHNHNQEEDEDAAGACVGSQDDDLCPEPAPLPRKMFSQDLIFEGDLTLPSTSKPRPPLEVQEIEATEEKDEDEEEEEEEEGEKEEVTTTVQDIQDLSLVVEALKRKLQEKNEEIVFLREDNHALRQGLDTSQDYIQGFGRKYGQLLRQTLIAKGLMSEVNSYLCKASKGEEQDVDEVTCRIKRCNTHQHQQGLQGSEDPNYLLEQKLLQWIDKENEKEKESISSISSTHIAELYKYPGETLSQAFVNEVAKVATRMNDLVEHLKTSNPSRTASTISM